MSRKDTAAKFAETGYYIDVIGRNLSVTEAMKDYANEKVAKIERFTDRIIDVSVTMEVQKIEQRCDIVVKAGHLTIKSHAATDNMYASIDKAVDKIQTQLTRYKKRIQDHQAKSHEVIEMSVNVLKAPGEVDLSDLNDQIEEENLRVREHTYHPHHIISKEKLPLKFLTNDEAILKMELTGDAFLIFRGEVDRKIKVIYRRKDGNYGIIEPEA